MDTSMLSKGDLRKLFTLNTCTSSDTHDGLKCSKCRDYMPPAAFPAPAHHPGARCSPGDAAPPLPLRFLLSPFHFPFFPSPLVLVTHSGACAGGVGSVCGVQSPNVGANNKERRRAASAAFAPPPPRR